MGKDIGIGVYPGFIALLIHIRPGEYLPVSGNNGSADNPFVIGILLCVVDIGIDFFCFEQVKPDQIASQDQKQKYKGISDNPQLRISPFSLSVGKIIGENLFFLMQVNLFDPDLTAAIAGLSLPEQASALRRTARTVLPAGICRVHIHIEIRRRTADIADIPGIP